MHRVIDWVIGGRMTATLVCDALTMALWKRRMATGVIGHSDGAASIVRRFTRNCSEHTGWFAA
ncbi:MAG: hypothetical protein EXR90_03000 [Methyloglobulus sp.]|nr:hypothetical protein [Methyloglobulus sp.]